MINLDELLEIFSIQLKKHKGDSWATLGTFSDTYPRLRNIIIRDYKENKLIFYTHALSNKVEELVANSASSLCWYSKRHGIQLQFYGHTFIIKENDHYKKRVTNFRDYLGAKPGLPLMDQNSDSIHFCVLEFNIQKIIGLKLGKEEHIKYERDLKSGMTKRVIP